MNAFIVLALCAVVTFAQVPTNGQGRQMPCPTGMSATGCTQLQTCKQNNRPAGMGPGNGMPKPADGTPRSTPTPAQQAEMQAKMQQMKATISQCLTSAGASAADISAFNSFQPQLHNGQQPQTSG